MSLAGRNDGPPEEKPRSSFFIQHLLRSRKKRNAKQQRSPGTRLASVCRRSRSQNGKGSKPQRRCLPSESSLAKTRQEDLQTTLGTFPGVSGESLSNRRVETVRQPHREENDSGAGGCLSRDVGGTSPPGSSAVPKRFVGRTQGAGDGSAAVASRRRRPGGRENLSVRTSRPTSLLWRPWQEW